MKKQMLSMMLSAALLLAIPGTAASADAAQSYALSDAQKQQADAAIEAYLSDIETGTSFSAQSGSDAAVTDYSAEDGFIVEYVNLFGEDASFDTISTAVRIPYANGVIDLSDNNGALEFSSRSIEENGTSDIYVTKKDEIRSTIDSTFEEGEIKSIRYVEDAMLYLSAVTVETSDALYVIPYFTSNFQKEYDGLVQGSIYKTEDFLEWVSESFKEQQTVNEDGELLYGAVGHTYTGGGSVLSCYAPGNSNLLLYVGISAGVLLLAGGAFFLTRKRGNLPAAQ